MSDQTPTPTAVITRLLERTNAHDLEGLVDCFSPDYQLTNPVHPARDFVGRDQVRRNWTGLFAGVPDLKASVTNLTADGELVWVELALGGTRRDGTSVHLSGVQIFTVRDALVQKCRFFLEPVEPVGVDADGAVREAVGPS